ncbi:MAG: UDP-N-acetylmuramoyl-L-alanine--D-glutamate ligase [Actinobacteria bacterium]|nr:UDP-N-acetylmuramoyl-L-alanine--D-glutamate ligase [Actinomycetota bacterium]
MADLGVGCALVVGLGRSGVPAVHALLEVGAAVVATDREPHSEHADDLRAVGATVILGVSGEDQVDGVDVVVASPGVPEHAPVLRRAAELGVPVWSEPELGWRLSPRSLIAVTGTNGKTTVTELTTAMLQAGDQDAVACGNIGHPFTTAVREAASNAVLVAELSSFQLRFAETLRPAVGVLLNLAPDHLDWHGDVAAYGAAKARLWQAQQEGDWAVGNLDDEPSAALVRRHAPARVAWFSHTTVPELGVGVDGGRLVTQLPHRSGVVMDTGELGSAAPHHLANVAAAACAALLGGASPEPVADAARAYRPGRHRLELVADHGGVRWVNDSKATNPHAAAAALKAATTDHGRSVVWIAGGRRKGVDLAVLADELGCVRHAVLIGEAAPELADIAAQADVAVTRARSIEEAVAVAADLTRPGDTVLLAPACASFDQFRDYAERGDRFARAARTVTAGTAARR